MAAGCAYEIVSTTNDHAEIGLLLAATDGSEFELRSRRPDTELPEGQGCWASYKAGRRLESE